MSSNYDSLIKQYCGQLEYLLNSKTHNFSSIIIKDIPKVSGVYAIFGENCDLLYVGKTGNLQRRLIDNHLRGGRRSSAFRRNLAEHYDLDEERRITDYIKTCSFKYLESDEVGNMEHFAIAILKPKLNK